MVRATWFVLAGMGIVFATLGLLVLVMAGLNRVLGAKPAATGRPGAGAGRA